MQNMHKQNLLTTLMKTGAEQVSGEQNTLHLATVLLVVCFTTLLYHSL